MNPSRPNITRTTHVLPFEQLSWQDFERLSLALLLREDFQNPQHYGVVGGEQGRDIIATRNGQPWIVQCKRVKQCGPQDLTQVLDALAPFLDADPQLRPGGILFVMSCNVSAITRDRVAQRCADLDLACEIWGRTDLDARVQRHGDIVAEFFALPAPPAEAFDLLELVEGEPVDGDSRALDLSGDEEAWLQAYAFRTPDDLEQEIEHTQSLLQMTQLSWAKNQVSHASAEAPHLAAELEASQARLQEYKARLTELTLVLRITRRAGVPSRMLIKDLLEGNLYGGVLEVFIGNLRGEFDELDIVRQISDQCPIFRRRMTRRMLNCTDIDDQALAQAIHRQVEGLVNRPTSDYIRLPGGKYRKTLY